MRAGDDATYGFCNSCGDELIEGDDCCDDGEWEPYEEPATVCALCHKPATGFAFVNDDRYCHGDDDESPTCYERAQMPLADAQRKGLL